MAGCWVFFLQPPPLGNPIEYKNFCEKISIFSYFLFLFCATSRKNFQKIFSGPLLEVFEAEKPLLEVAGPYVHGIVLKSELSSLFLWETSTLDQGRKLFLIKFLANCDADYLVRYP